MKNACGLVCKILGYCAVIYILYHWRESEMRPDLRPIIRSVGHYISSLYPEEKVSTMENRETAYRVERLVHELPQTPRD